MAPVAAGEDDPVVLIPTSGTTGRSKLVTQTHRAYVMAGEGFPWWMELTADDRLMTSLPLFHINAPAYSVLGSVAARAGLVLLPRFSASRFLDDARRYGATEFNAIGAMLEILMRQPERDDDADNPLRLCYTGPSPPAQRQLEIEERFGLRIVCGYAMSETPYGTDLARTAPGRTARSARVRQHPPGHVNEARVVDEGARSDGESASWSCATRRSCAATGRCPRRPRRPLRPTAGCAPATWSTGTRTGPTRSSARKKEVIRRRGENVAPAEIEEALAAHPDVPRRRSSACRRSCPRRRSRRSSPVAGPDDADLAAIREARPPRASRRSRCRATSRRSPSCRTRRPAGSPSTSCRRSATTTRSTSTPAQERPAERRDWLHTDIGGPTPTRSPSAAATWRAS